ncbi:MAG: anaerobic ribonucleoside-triphosphate reductase activating protein [Burkholderiales bacterium RIFCSPLOWO2_02_FULL_57_36]|nr:MAG: anaerobic ribonucleoside-triphosphate reductase activating protein [Burkholderiales bacterium RIFCSPLOWO2_02_FULL_57_36]
MKRLPRSAASSTQRMLRVGGITPFSATDYPGKLAAVVFVQGCPWRCGYCHNPHLQPRLPGGPLDWTRIRNLLQRRVGLVDAVVFSGGEPTIDPCLANAIGEVRELGFKVGLHSGGIYPTRFNEILPMLDWVGFDIKAPFDHRYERITGVADSATAALDSAQAIISSNVDYEFRTTIHPALLDEDDIMALAQTLAAMGATSYALQVFRAQGCGSATLNAVPVTGYPSDDLVQRVAALFPEFILRRN